MSTENIQKFLRPPDKGGAYTDEKLAALLAHAEDGKLVFQSCCCLIGVATADHALRGEREAGFKEPHYSQACTIAANLTGQDHCVTNAEWEYSHLGFGDAKRRERLIPLILAEFALRALEREACLTQPSTENRSKIADSVQVADADQQHPDTDARSVTNDRTQYEENESPVAYASVRSR